MSSTMASSTCRKIFILLRIFGLIKRVDGFRDLVLCSQFLEEEDQVSPLICAWDFIVSSPKRAYNKPTTNETASLLLQVEVAHSLNLTQVQRRSQCRPDGNYLEVNIPGNDTFLLLLCTKKDDYRSTIKGIHFIQ